jgi:hypothetical protein
MGWGKGDVFKIIRKCVRTGLLYARIVVRSLLLYLPKFQVSPVSKTTTLTAFERKVPCKHSVAS